MGFFDWLIGTSEERLEKLRLQLKVVLKELESCFPKDDGFKELMNRKNELVVKIDRLERKLGVGVHAEDVTLDKRRPRQRVKRTN